MPRPKIGVETQGLPNDGPPSCYSPGMPDYNREAKEEANHQMHVTVTKLKPEYRKILEDIEGVNVLEEWNRLNTYQIRVDDLEEKERIGHGIRSLDFVKRVQYTVGVPETQSASYPRSLKLNPREIAVLEKLKRGETPSRKELTEMGDEDYQTARRINESLIHGTVLGEEWNPEGNRRRSRI